MGRTITLEREYPNLHKSVHTIDNMLKQAFPRLIIPVSIVVTWEVLYQFGLVNEATLSTPSLILLEFVKLIRSGELLVHAWHSLYLIILAFFLSCLAAIPLGIAMGAKEIFFNLFDPLIELIRPIPPLALLPLAIVWLGIGVSEKLFILIIGTFPPIVINSYHGVRSTERVLIQAARSMGASDRDILYKVLFPSALPNIFVGMQIAIGFAFTVIVAAELVATQNGLGYLLTIGWRTYNLEMIFVSIIMIGLLAYLMELILRYVRKKVIKWQTVNDSPLKTFRR